MNKAYKFRLYPNKDQSILINRTFGCCRLIYNKMLEDKITCYEKTKENLKVSPAHYKKDFEFLKEVDSLALCSEWKHLETAYKNFFRNKTIGFPKFKSKHKDRKSYTTNMVNKNIKLSDKYITLPKLGMIKVKKHREIPESYKLKSCTISQNPSGKYFVSILFEYEETVAPKEIETAVGLDYSMAELYVSSDSEFANYPKFYKQAQNKLKKAQRKLSKMQKGSNNRNKQRIKVAKLHEKVSNSRKDFLHKQSRKIANSYDLVCIENLNMKAMQKALNFAKSVSDNAWGMFTTFLEYKLKEQGKQLIKVDKWFPSSKTCSVCGAKKDELALSQRVYICDCGNILDRDINAAINIKNEGLRIALA